MILVVTIHSFFDLSLQNALVADATVGSSGGLAMPAIQPNRMPDRRDANGCVTIGRRGADITIPHYPGCFGPSDEERILIPYLRAIEDAGGPSISVILVMRRFMPNDPVENHFEQAGKLKEVVNGFSKEEQKYLPAFITAPGFMAKAKGAYSIATAGTQLWHPLKFKLKELEDEHSRKRTVTIPDLDAIEPIRFAAGEEVTARVEETMRHEAVRDFIVLSHSFGTAMAMHQVYFRPVPEGMRLLGAVFGAAPIPRQCVQEGRMHNLDVDSTVIMYEKDPISTKALEHTPDDVRQIVQQCKMTNTEVVVRPGGHWMDVNFTASRVGRLVNKHYRRGQPIH